jgi:hypothetical protein
MRTMRPQSGRRPDPRPVVQHGGTDRVSARWQPLALAVIAALAGCERACGPAEPGRSASPSATPPPDAGGPPVAPRDPFAGLTPARIDDLDAEGLCFEPCRVHLECFAKNKPEAAGPPSALERMVSICRTSCWAEKLSKPDPAQARAARECLKKFDCDAFDDCYFGQDTPPAPAGPRPTPTTTRPRK